MDRVLLVDDTLVFREPVAAALRRSGYKVSEAGNGNEALNTLKFNTPQIILLDVAMPEMDGLTFLKRVRSIPEFRDLPVILLTAIADKECVVKAKDLSVTDYLVKSYFSLEELLGKVREALRSRHRYYDEPSAPEATKPSSDGLRLTHIEETQKNIDRLRNPQRTRPLPGTIRSVLALTSAGDVPADELATLIAQDQVLAGKVLGMANSSLFAGSRSRTTDLHDAVMKIGFQAIRNIVAGVGISQALAPDKETRLLWFAFIERSLALAHVLEHLVPIENKELASNAYLVGLFAHYANQVKALETPELFQRMTTLADRHNCPIEALSKDFLAISEVELQQQLLTSLGVSEEIIESISAYAASRSGESPLPNNSLLQQALSVASRYVSGLYLGAPIRDPLESVKREELNHLRTPALSAADFRKNIRVAALQLSGFLSADRVPKLAPFELPGRVFLARSTGFSDIDPIEAALTAYGDIHAGSTLPDLLDAYSGAILFSDDEAQLNDWKEKLRGTGLPWCSIVDMKQDTVHGQELNCPIRFGDLAKLLTGALLT